MKKQYSIFASQLGFFLLLPIWMKLISYLHPVVIVVVWIVFTVTFCFIAFLITKQTVTLSSTWLHVVMSLYTISLFILLFFRPENQQYGTINLIPFETIRFYFTGHVSPLIAFYNLSANIGLFIPFGLYYRFISNTPRLILLLCISILSISIVEILQYATKRGSLDIDDLILNVLGFCIGYFLFTCVQKVLHLKR
ncbi:VanZ family protein [Alkalihalobacterium bogoriense]|uniref:VanZ family protein n=1 Tax=Alkalihalobacterium bogoriense TaxID=246272 RepID=UPI00047BF91B|nr:VanZ family protein [Alkalihalobacterium bogoriense]